MKNGLIPPPYDEGFFLFFFDTEDEERWLELNMKEPGLTKEEYKEYRLLTKKATPKKRRNSLMKALFHQFFKFFR